MSVLDKYLSLWDQLIVSRVLQAFSAHDCYRVFSKKCNITYFCFYYLYYLTTSSLLVFDLQSYNTYNNPCIMGDRHITLVFPDSMLTSSIKMKMKICNSAFLRWGSLLWNLVQRNIYFLNWTKLVIWLLNRY